MHNNGSSAHFDWQGNSIFDEWIFSRDYAPSSGRLHFAMQEWMVVAGLDVGACTLYWFGNRWAATYTFTTTIFNVLCRGWCIKLLLCCCRMANRVNGSCSLSLKSSSSCSRVRCGLHDNIGTRVAVGNRRQWLLILLPTSGEAGRQTPYWLVYTIFMGHIKHRT